MKICIAGGDLRQVYAANALKEAGHEVLAYGFDPGLPFEEGISLQNDFEGLELLILPLGIRKGRLLNTPLWEGKADFEELLSRLPKGCAISGGNLTEEEQLLLKGKGFRVRDYFKEEALTAANAVLTAEAAIQLAMTEPISLWGSRCLILGYGRIGKALCKLLHSFGAKVTVMARDAGQRFWASWEGGRVIGREQLESVLPEQDFVFNTIPAPLLKKEELALTSPSVLLLELASKPYGIDREAAEELGRSCILASGLPGKHSPKTAGELIAKTILDIHGR